ncbi:alkyl/aryl-sulfatase [Paenibacillus typhae]|uniref:alkyl/aryl-sulfatase n=1 Tax=Paenibacillus typhae TaxID=1174501 RepID=UPI001C8ECDC8|nr:alkyl sulfatase dimerization domain-containing protein [Paenibacillus typhae]MBY0011695.1 MBL fold metallo-hydrolase [Paenibacillus typhae]
MTFRTSTPAKPATSFTQQLHGQVLDELPFDDRQDFEDARRGFIAEMDKDPADTAFLDAEAPVTVNPSLWRNAQLHAITGLFKVVDGIYQVRGQNIATIVIVEGETGIIVVDASITVDFAKAALELYYAHRPRKPVTAVIISQSHVDHWGGIAGVLKYAESPDIPVIAPLHFTEEALSENLLLGTIMLRRAIFQMGTALPAGPDGYVSDGIGHRSAEDQSSSFHLPTEIVQQDGEQMTLDGITFEFILALNTEAPSEMVFYINNYEVFFVSEISNKTLHQVYAVRGAKTRDALAWASALDKVIDLAQEKPLKAIVNIHSWPVWGKEHALQHLTKQRDLYKYIHDQTVRLANLGLTMDEIAESIRLPESLGQFWANRGYYGTLKLNAKAVYNYYLGHYSAHPSDLDPLPPVEAGLKYLQYLGGAANVVRQAKADFDNGEYRWVAQVLKHVIFAEPDHEEAKALLADAFEQLGYQAESALWRNVYLTGAAELRNGLPQQERRSLRSAAWLTHIPVNEFFKQLAVRLNGLRAEGASLGLQIHFTDIRQDYALTVSNSVLIHKENRRLAAPELTLMGDRAFIYALLFGQLTPAEAIAADKIRLTGDAGQLSGFLSLFDSFSPLIPIVTP